MAPVARNIECSDSTVRYLFLTRQVAVKMNAVVTDPSNELQREAEVHNQAWHQLPYVIPLLGFLPAHAPTGFPAVLVMDVVT